MSEHISENEPACHCGKLGCEICRVAVQDSFEENGLDTFEPFPFPHLLSVVSDDGHVPFRGLNEFEISKYREKCQKRLSQCLPVDCIAMGAVDVSLNSFENKITGWNFHSHAVLSRPLNGSELKKLKERFPRNCTLDVYKPVVQKPIAQTELRSTLRYVCKSFYTRRSTYIAKPKSERKPYRNSCGQDLTVKEDAMLNAALAKYRVSDLLIFVGLKRQRTSDPTKLRLVRTSR